MADGLRNRKSNPGNLSSPTEQGVQVMYNLWSDFQDHLKIGSGGFGLVLRVKKNDENRPTALKLIPFNDRLTVEKTLSEAIKLSSLQPHPSVIQCLDFWRDSFTQKQHKRFVDAFKPNKDEVFNAFPYNATKLEFLCIRMELCGNGNLREWLKKRKEVSAVFLESVNIFLQLVNGVAHIHQQGLIHRDLKPNNILFNGRSAKIGDFGLSVTHNPGDYCHTTRAGAQLYQAPEQSYGQYGRPVDYYALGLILFELVHPPSQVNVGEALTALKYGRTPAELTRACPEVAQTIQSLIAFEPKERPNPDQICQQIINWPQISVLGLTTVKTVENHLKNLTLGCNNCDKILTGVRFKCSTCDDYFLCEECEAIDGVHPISHDLLKIKTAVPKPNLDAVNKNDSENGCQHYPRKCAIQCPTKGCEKYFPCRICHDEIVKGHKLNRAAVAMIQCNICKTKQTPKRICINCRTEFAKYYCSTCHLYDNSDEAEKLIFHCMDCGFCRRKEDKWIEYNHCSNCGMCFPHSTVEGGVRRYFPEHECKFNAGKSPCPVCKKEMYESRERCVLVACQHYVHEKCKSEFPPGETKCPVCGVW